MNKGMLTASGRPLLLTVALTATVLLAGLGVFGLAGCSSDEGDPPGTTAFPEPTGNVWLFDIWGTAADDIWVVGRPGIILHYDGSSWSLQQVPVHTLTDVWGTAANDVYAVGHDGKILHFDGNNWSSQESGTTADLFAVGTGPWGEIYAVGNNGTLRRKSGATWAETDNRVYWYSQNDTLLRDEDIRSLTTVTRFGIAGSDAIVVAKSDTAGHTWKKGSIEDPKRAWLTASWSDEEFSGNFLANESGRLFQYRYFPTTLTYAWAEISSPASIPAPITAMWVTPDGADQYFTTRWGRISHRAADGSSSENVHLDKIWYSGIWGTDNDNIYACGYNGTMIHFDGTEWTYFDVPLPSIIFKTPGPETDKFGRPLP